jgi:hypothetical protein
MSAIAPAPIIALTILDAATLGPGARILGSTRLLVGVRNPATNPTHPNVMSVPTRRVPRVLLDEMLRRGPEHGIREDAGLKERASQLGLAENILRVGVIEAPLLERRAGGGHDATTLAVEALLSGKLGLADALESGKIDFASAPALHAIGSVLYERTSAAIPGEPVTIDGVAYCRELCEFVNIRVDLRGVEHLPEETASYSQIRWINVDDFHAIVRTRDVGLLHLLFGDPAIHYCVHGLCLTTSHLALP